LLYLRKLKSLDETAHGRSEQLPGRLTPACCLVQLRQRQRRPQLERSRLLAAGNLNSARKGDLSRIAARRSDPHTVSFCVRNNAVAIACESIDTSSLLSNLANLVEFRGSVGLKH